VYLGVTGNHVRGFKNRGVHPVVSADREISEEDVSDVVKNAKIVNLPAQDHVIHAIRQHFLVDGQDGIANPVGMLGSRVEVDVHVVHGNVNRLQNAIRTVKGLQLEVDDIVFTGLGSSLAVLSPEEKELGALVIDLGGGTTEYVVYANGVIRHTGVLAVGGDHISNDLAYGLKVSVRRAEQLKLEHGSALFTPDAHGKTVEIKDDLGRLTASVNLEHLRRIMSVRLEEIFQLILQDLDQADALDYLRAGAFLCGGGARVPEITTLASRVLQMPAALAKISAINGLRPAIDQPEFATGIGLVKFGSMQQRKREARTSLSQGIRATFGQWFKR